MYTQDETVQSNYIPRTPQEDLRDYLKTMQDDDMESLRHERTQCEERRTHAWFERMQQPLLVSLLFFIFQMASFQRTFSVHLGFLGIVKEDGHLNISGIVLKSVLFGAIVGMIEELVSPMWCM